ncbi:tRNA (N6-isopentenyl adenosine(37)-C2)-methylthiotransferase MiaB [Garciella nitratireducens]|uniref:tRNA-2-methylthio-N(6)-dimethylallyladenosine synthase n=1 Tax=Garciella nitratireducens DSM 15102 TaxID=1121911 RepID=A0A1T4JVD8_9FIRM|nr:tRNA (N6-isopentenyl adenosine(37)-C2)-methylthiotransferase MiaB [Garciella nitratireducens]SJZ34126.1 tRNA-i(6)A37 thiotransferase enzyme MiaB [Garciella nitratireducens DSM 15102]
MISNNKNKYYKISTYGCQMNENDSEKLAGMLKNMGYKPTEIEEQADIIILNTCSVRENADIKVFGNLGHYKPLKKKNPNLILAVCGCMMQQKEIVEKIKEKYPQVDLVFGTHNIHKFPELLANAQQSSCIVIDVWENGGEIIESVPIERKYKHKAFVTIMYGCDNFCSYCIVPYTRGREKSREPEKIIKEVIHLAQDGCKEITLLGQNVNSYGKTLKNPISFAQLLRKLNQIDGIKRIRFMTSHPKDLSDELILAMKECDKVCEHIHLPFQAGSNKILKIMNRRYTKESYLELIKKLKETIPGIAITTDIIVGFPGENQDDFKDTLDIVRKVKFDSAFTFLYSIRKGTPAAKMENQIPDDIKHERFNRLLELQQSISREKNALLKNEVVEVLVDGTSKNDEEKMCGRTRTNKLVNFIGDKNLIGEFVQVKITDPHTWSLNGVQLGYENYIK